MQKEKQKELAEQGEFLEKSMQEVLDNIWKMENPEIAVIELMAKSIEDKIYYLEMLADATKIKAHQIAFKNQIPLERVLLAATTRVIKRLQSKIKKGESSGNVIKQ